MPIKGINFADNPEQFADLLLSIAKYHDKANLEAFIRVEIIKRAGVDPEKGPIPESFYNALEKMTAHVKVQAKFKSQADILETFIERIKKKALGSSSTALVSPKETKETQEQNQMNEDELLSLFFIEYIKAYSHNPSLFAGINSLKDLITFAREHQNIRIICQRLNWLTADNQAHPSAPALIKAAYSDTFALPLVVPAAEQKGEPKKLKPSADELLKQHQAHGEPTKRPLESKRFTELSKRFSPLFSETYGMDSSRVKSIILSPLKEINSYYGLKTDPKSYDLDALDQHKQSVGIVFVYEVIAYFTLEQLKDTTSPQQKEQYLKLVKSIKERYDISNADLCLVFRNTAKKFGDTHPDTVHFYKLSENFKKRFEREVEHAGLGQINSGINAFSAQPDASSSKDPNKYKRDFLWKFQNEVLSVHRNYKKNAIKETHAKIMKKMVPIVFRYIDATTPEFKQLALKELKKQAKTAPGFRIFKSSDPFQGLKKIIQDEEARIKHEEANRKGNENVSSPG